MEEKITKKQILDAIKFLSKSKPRFDEDLAYFLYCFHCKFPHSFNPQTSEKCRNQLQHEINNLS